MLDPGFYNMDCMQGMAHFPDKFFDIAIVDPPYGTKIGHKTGQKMTIVAENGGGRPFGGATNPRSKTGKDRPYFSTFYHAFDDSSPPDEQYFRELMRVSKAQIIWGGNFILDKLNKPASCMIVWDKKKRGMSQADCEIAWTSLKGQSRIFEWRWNGMLQQDMKHKEKRIHPTQKPVALYRWILEKYAKPGMKILDTHVGSASSLIACREAGLDAWGFEIDPVFYEMAVERMKEVNTT